MDALQNSAVTKTRVGEPRTAVAFSARKKASDAFFGFEHSFSNIYSWTK